MYWTLCCPHTDQILLKLPAEQNTLGGHVLHCGNGWRSVINCTIQKLYPKGIYGNHWKGGVVARRRISSHAENQILVIQPIASCLSDFTTPAYRLFWPFQLHNNIYLSGGAVEAWYPALYFNHLVQYLNLLHPNILRTVNLNATYFSALSMAKQQRIFNFTTFFCIRHSKGLNLFSMKDNYVLSLCKKIHSLF